VADLSPIQGQLFFKHRNETTGVPTLFHLVTTKSGRLEWRKADGTFQTLDAAAFTADGPVPSCAVAQNLGFIYNGKDTALKVDESAGAPVVSRVGILRPGAAPVLASEAVGDPKMQGDYEIALSYYNSASKHESSLSDYASVTLAVLAGIHVTWPGGVPDPQITHVRVHIRKPAITSQFTQASEVLVAVGEAHLNLSDSDLNNLIVLSPNTVENDPPPTTAKGPVWHLSRVFVHDDVNIYWSKRGKPEAFHPDDYEPVNADDGQKIVGLVQFTDARLVVFKDNSIYEWVGDNVASMSLRVVSPSVGCTSIRSARVVDGILYWWSKQGPMAWSGTGEPEPIGVTTILPTIDQDALEYLRLGQVVSGVDYLRGRLVWALPEKGYLNNTLLLPFNYRFKCWEASRWDLFDVCSMAEGEDTSGNQWVYLTDYLGRVFEFWNADVDGLTLVDGLGDPYTLWGKVSSATDTKVTMDGANFDISLANGALRDFYLYMIAPNGTVQRRKILSNTATEITVTTAFDAVPTSEYVFVVSSPIFEWDTKWSNSGDSFTTKRYNVLQADALSSGGTIAYLHFFTKFDLGLPVRSYYLNCEGLGAVFDVDKFDEAVFGSEGISRLRQHIGRVGEVYRVRVMQYEPNRQFLLLGLSVQANAMSDKR